MRFVTYSFNGICGDVYDHLDYETHASGKLCILYKHGLELAWRSSSVMDCHTTARGLIPSGNGVKT